jgi:hypothetical protein
VRRAFQNLGAAEHTQGQPQVHRGMKTTEAEKRPIRPARWPDATSGPPSAPPRHVVAATPKSIAASGQIWSAADPAAGQWNREYEVVQLGPRLRPATTVQGFRPGAGHGPDSVGADYRPLHGWLAETAS